MTSIDSIRDQIEAEVTTEDIKGESTLQSIDEVATLISKIDSDSVNTLVSLGVGSGALTKAIGTCFDTTNIHGIDMDPEAKANASNRGINVHDINVESDSLPFDTDSADLVVSFGLLEHLTWYDNVLQEATRILRPGGYLLFAMPNMAGWTNRISLLTGHQPRNVEFSREKPFGIMDAYGADYTVGHVHTPTVAAFQEYLEYHGYGLIDTVGLHPYQKRRFVSVIDRLVSSRPSLCRRFATLAQLPTEQ